MKLLHRFGRNWRTGDQTILTLVCLSLSGTLPAFALDKGWQWYRPSTKEFRIFMPSPVIRKSDRFFIKTCNYSASTTTGLYSVLAHPITPDTFEMIVKGMEAGSPTRPVEVLGVRECKGIGWSGKVFEFANSKKNSVVLVAKANGVDVMYDISSPEPMDSKNTKSFLESFCVLPKLARKAHKQLPRSKFLPQTNKD